MKRTKKEVYAEYGIQYVKDGSSEKIYCEPLKKWINPLLVYGSNTKVGKAYTFSIMHGNELFTIENVHNKVAAVMENANIKEIKGSCPCHCEHCYCDNGCYNFPDNKAKAIEKLILARLFPEWLERAIIAQLKADNKKNAQVRIHAQGDFCTSEYSNAWKNIIKACPDCIFWTYTKEQDALKAFVGLENISVVPSITPYGFNFGTCSDLLKKYNALKDSGKKVHICACGTSMEKHCSECTTGCKAIGKTCEYVLFIEHSTSTYKAGESDPVEYQKVCDIIAMQDN